MDKQYLIKNKFHLGQTDSKNPRDLIPGELYYTLDAQVDEKGQLRTMGAFLTNHQANAVNDGSGITLAPGQGLHAWAADRNAAGANQGTQMLAVGDKSGGKTYLYDAGADNWFANVDTTGSTLEGVYYDYAGGLRVSDGSFAGTNKIYQYIERTHFPGLDIAETTDSWREIDHDMDAPSGGDVTTDGSEPTLSNLEIGLQIQTDSAIGGWPDKVAFFGTFVYEHNQESLPTQIGTIAGYEDLDLKLKVFMKQPAGAFAWATHYDPRMVGARIYYSKLSDDSTTVFESEMYLLCEVDMSNGARATDADNWSAWGDSTRADHVEAPGSTSFLIFENPPDFETYETINGYPPTIDSISFGNSGDGYKTATVINGVVYVGYTRRTITGGEQLTEPDAVYKTPFGKPDTFPDIWKVVAASNDGESIVKLDSFGEILFQFKEKTLYIIDTAQGIERRIGKYPTHGILSPGSAIETPLGIAWLNKGGLYLSNGGQPINLLERGAEKLIKSTTWNSFITDDSMIGYIADKKQLVIMKGADGSSNDDDILLFDILDRSIAPGNSIGPGSSNIYTNFVTDWNNDCVVVSGVGTVSKWDDTMFSKTTFDVFFNDEDFGYPGTTKKIYSVTVNYQAGTTNIIDMLKYGINGDYACTSSVATKTINTASVWTNAKYTFSSPISCDSFMLRMDINQNSTFQLNHYIIEYRVLPFNKAT